MTQPIFPVSSLTLTSSGSAVVSYLPYDVSSMKLPTQVVVRATGQGAYVRLSSDASMANSTSVLVQAGDQVMMSVMGRQWVSVLSDGASSKVSISALSTGVWGNAVVPALNITFAGASTLDPRITFARGTNATLTDSNGRVAYAPHNLLTNSEDFEAAAWTKLTGGAGVTPVVTANFAAAPDGSLTADRVQLDAGANGASDYSLLRQTFTGTSPLSRTLWVKSNTGANQTISLVATNPLTKITVTPTWQRLGDSQTSAGTSQFDISVGGAGLTGATADILVWGAQANLGSTAQSYNPTTPKNLLGFTQEPENAAWTKSNSYVQQNLLTWSQDFDNAAWVKTGFNAFGAGSVANTTATLDPLGGNTADYIQENAITTEHYVYPSGGIAVGAGSYRGSVYAKAAERSRLVMGIWNGTNYELCQFDLANGVVLQEATPGIASIQSAGNGWWRCGVSRTIGATTAYLSLGPNTNTNIGTLTGAWSNAAYTGNGTSGIYIWGAQLVQGSTAGDYTQTTSAAAPTRYVNWDGTLTGRKLVEDTANTQHRVFQQITTPAGGTYTFYAYLRAAERTRAFVLMSDNVTGSAGAYVDLAAGTITADTATVGAWVNISSSIQSVGGGWYRVGVTGTKGSATSILGMVYLSNGASTSSANGYTGDGTSGIYVSDFQLSNSASVDPYVYNPQAAAASAAFYGPRFDYNPTTLAANGLLIEEQRTNLLTYSEQFDNAAWTKNELSVTQDATVSPSGIQNAEKIIATAVSAEHEIRTPSLTLAPATYTFSIYAKAGEYRYVRVGFSGTFGGNSGYVVFDLQDEIITYASNANLVRSIQNAGNGWYRCIVTNTTTLNATATNYVGINSNSTTGTSFTGNNVNGLHLWGAQIEAGSFATSYVPTQASQVTRSADLASMLGDNFYTWYNPNQGTYFVQASSQQTGGVLQSFFQDGNITLATNGGGNLNVFNGSTYFGIAIQVTGINATTFKSSIGYISGASASGFATNGAAPSTFTNPGLAPQAAFGIGTAVTGGSSGARNINGHIRRISYYNTRLPNSTLQALTT